MQPTVFVIDDDSDMRLSLKWLIESINQPVECFDSAEGFLESQSVGRAGCILLDVRMPGMGGIRLLEHLSGMGCTMPVIIFTAHGEISMAVQTMKIGAFDFLEKPSSHHRILACIQEALQMDRQNRERSDDANLIENLLLRLSPRERQILDHLKAGQTTQHIARELHISNRTVEKHRTQIVRKMEVRSIGDLFRIMIDSQKLNS